MKLQRGAGKLISLLEAEITAGPVNLKQVRALSRKSPDTGSNTVFVVVNN